MDKRREEYLNRAARMRAMYRLAKDETEEFNRLYLIEYKRLSERYDNFEILTPSAEEIRKRG